MAADRYYIANGVRRAVAAREVGCKSITALLRRPGQSDQVRQVPLAALFSPKTTIHQSDGRFRRIINNVTIPAEFVRIPPIEVEPLGAPGQTSSIPVKDVVLLP